MYLLVNKQQGQGRSNLREETRIMQRKYGKELPGNKKLTSE